jgi:hypothetical protein
MSATVRLSSKLPGEEEINGLDHLASSLLDSPHQVLVAICWLDVPKITEDTDKDERVPTVRVRRVEPIDVIAKVPDAILKLAAELFESRTGRRALPFDVLDVEHGGYVGNPEED